MGLVLPLAVNGTALTGAGVAVLAFVLATARDEWIRRRDLKVQDRNVVNAIREEIEVNLAMVISHRDLVAQELTLLPNGQRLVNPLDPLATGFWEMVKFNPPASLSSRTLTKARDVARVTVQVNEILRSRELFRVSSPLLTMEAVSIDGKTEAAWAGPLRGYDELLERFLEQLYVAMMALAPDLGVYARQLGEAPAGPAASPDDAAARGALAGFADAAATSGKTASAAERGALAAFAGVAAEQAGGEDAPEPVSMAPAPATPAPAWAQAEAAVPAPEPVAEPAAETPAPAATAPEPVAEPEPDPYPAPITYPLPPRRGPLRPPERSRRPGHR